MPVRKRPGHMRFEDEPDPPRRSRGRSRDDDFDLDDEGEIADDEDEPPRRRAGSSRRAPSGRGRPAAGRDAVRPRRRTEREEDSDRASDDERDDYSDELHHAPPRREKRRKMSLLNLCTPIFGYAAVLPRDAGDTHPAYPAFRQEVLTALQRLEKDAPDHGIDREDVREAAYALCCFLDEQVAGSQWTGKGQWAAEPLGIVLHQDPEGGVNFFRRLEGLGDRQKAAKQVFLVCLAFGFRGKYVELDPTQQVAQIGDIRQRILRDIHPTEMERLRRLFPDAYVQAIPIESEGPPPRPWWLWASLAVVALAIVIWVILFLLAGPPDDVVDQIRSVASLPGVDGEAWL